MTLATKQKHHQTKKVGNNRDFFPMPLSYTPQMKVSKEQKYTRPDNSVWKWTPAVPEDLISNAQQCETVKHFWACPLQKGLSVAKHSNCRKYVKGSCAFSVSEGELEPGAPPAAPPAAREAAERTGTTGYVRTFVPLWHQHTESPLDLLHTLLIICWSCLDRSSR